MNYNAVTFSYPSGQEEKKNSYSLGQKLKRGLVNISTAKEQYAILSATSLLLMFLKPFVYGDSIEVR